MVVGFVLRHDFKVIPLDVMSSGFDVVVSNGWLSIVIFSEALKCLIGFLTMKPSFSFTNVKTITIPAICSVNNSGLLWAINVVLLRKKRFGYASIVHWKMIFGLTQE